ncbi:MULTISPECIES: antitoxin [Mycobacterium]|uniref:AbrB/MazE/SpoVT family DNA-binding domain-containing protein n=1 Tax=Mycobacterium TaxID=1763 RepID=UPI001F3BE14C|nr:MULTISPECIES: antitoxin [Mycobacterium]MDA3642001.1 antitoxin [Mycobacterium xenopi]MDA3660234.1 antitoxin [Mycobacterium xenopi]
MEVGVFTTKLRKVGGSVMLAIPPALLEMLDLNAGAPVGLSVDAGQLVVDPQVRPHYTLDELLGQCDASADFTIEDQDWLNGEAVGGELL